MSGFDLASVLPFYLDEADEQIAALNDRLLRLEQSPGDEAAIRDTFRLIHTLKGSSTMLGFDQVKGLTHHLETIFDQLRGGKRTLDRPFLDLCFRCLDGLRDYHADLRARGSSDVDLSGLTASVLRHLEGQPEPALPATPEPPAPEPGPEREPPPARAEPPAPTAPLGGGAVELTIVFEPNLPWPDMKAKLVLTRLAAKGRIASTEPTAELLEDIKSLPELRVWIETECDPAELTATADVDGVRSVRISSGPLDESIEEPEAPPGPAEPVSSPPTAAPAPPRAPDELTQAAPKAAPPQAEAPRARVVETVRVDVDRLDFLMNLAGELVINKSRFFEIAKGLEELFRASNGRNLAGDTLDRLDGIAAGLEALEGRPELARGATERISSQLRRLRENFRAIRDELDLVRQGREYLGAMGEAIHHLARVCDGIQRGVLETRMVPIGPLFDRFHRVVRDLRHASGKEVTLRIEGEKTELDKRMIDELGDPLIHLVRNAVDHGLEPPEHRQGKGKPRAGTVTLAASHRGNSVVITVADDGRGIDVERVRRKAVSRGLIDEEGSRRLDERQIIQYIWHPGLSTAESVTDISGRGVGMDIVKSRIEALNGTVDVRTEPGIGTTFVVRLPLTLAIMSVLLTRAVGEAYAIPLDHLDEIVEVPPGQVHQLRGRASIEVRGRVISVVSLGEVLHGRPPLARPDGPVTVVVVSNGEGTLGLVVDELMGMQEAVLKSLERNFRAVAGLSGASILGDGRVSLILDVDAVIDMVARGPARRPAHAALAHAEGGA
jgi:two-component system chemotaxis sensor kinase CheA